VRSCLIAGEVERGDEKGVAAFQLYYSATAATSRRPSFTPSTYWNWGGPSSGEPIEAREATLAGILVKSRAGVRLKEHMEHPEGAVVFQHAFKMGLEGIVSKRLGSRGGIPRKRSPSPHSMLQTDAPRPHTSPALLTGERPHPDILQNLPKGRLRGQAHGSIRIQEGEPNAIKCLCS
jgi:hypothetical protein